jgi:hypothetical protein
MDHCSVLKGFSIVILDRGFVYVGDTEHDGEWCVVKNAENIRRWGTSRGLGQLALEGPTKDTVLDDVGTVRAPAHAVIHLIDTEPKLWKKCC